MRNPYFYLALLLTIAITAGSLMSLEGGHIPTPEISDKLVHIVGYFLLTFSWEMVYNKYRRSVRISGLVAIAVFVYGIVIEVLQGSIGTNRQFERFDIYANFLGICIAILFFSIVFRKKPVN